LLIRKEKVREILKIVDEDHHTFEWYGLRTPEATSLRCG
jgi:hypothetical protein